MIYFEIIIVAVVVLVPAGIGFGVWVAARAARKTRQAYYEDFIQRKKDRMEARQK